MSLIETAVQAALDTGHTDRFISALKSLAAAVESDTLDSFIENYFPPGTDDAQLRSLPVVGLTLNSAETAPSCLRPDEAMFLYAIGKTASYAYSEGHQEAASWLDQIGRNLEDHLVSHGAVSLALGRLRDMARRSNTISRARSDEFREFFKRVSNQELALLARDSKLELAIGSQPDASVIQPIFVELLRYRNELQEEGRREDVAYKKAVEQWLDDLPKISMDRLRGLSIQELITTLIRLRLDRSIASFQYVPDAIFWNLDFHQFRNIRSYPYTLQSLCEPSHKSTLTRLLQRFRRIRLLQRFRVACNDDRELRRLLSPVNPVLLATALSLFVTQGDSFQSYIENYINSVLIHADLDRALIDLDALKVGDLEPFLDTEDSIMAAIEEIGRRHMDVSRHFIRGPVSESHVLWSHWVAVNPSLQIGEIALGVGWNLAQEYAEEMNSEIHNTRIRIERQRKQLAAELIEAFNSNQQGKSIEALERRDMIASRLHKRALRLYNYLPAEILANAFAGGMMQQFLRGLSGR